MQREYSFEPTEYVSETVSGEDKRACMKTDSEVTILNEVAERILDPANGKPCQT